MSSFNASTKLSPSSSYSQKLSGLVSGTPVPLMIVVAIIVLTAVIVFIVIKVKKGSLESVDLLNTPVISANAQGGEFYIAPAAKLPTSGNGNVCTYSLWLFVDNVSITNDHKIVMYRGNSGTFANGTFFAYMDAKTNTLYASMRTNGALTDGSTSNPTLSNIRNNKYFLHSKIDYIPLQRWVNVSYSLKDTVLSTFLDGDLYSVTSIYEMPMKPDGSRPLPSKQSGDIMIGGKAAKPGFTGYIGNSKFYNFSVTLAEAKVMYNQGPYKKSWLSYIGLSNVALRNPVYKVSTEDVK